MPKIRNLIIHKMDKNTYLISIRYISTVIDRIEDKFIIKKKGGKYVLDDNYNIYIRNTTLMTIIKDVAFVQAFKKLLKSGKDKIEVPYTLTASNYISILNKFIKND